MTVLATCVLIVLARIVDVSLGTLRTIFIVQGRRFAAAGLGFVEVLIWITVVSKVIQNLDHVVYAVSYAAGFSLGTYSGIRIEAWLAPGRQVLRVFTRRGKELARHLREQGFALTEFAGTGQTGPVDLLLLEASRRRVGQALPLVATVDPDALTVVDDVRPARSAAAGTLRPFWGLPVKKK